MKTIKLILTAILLMVAYVANAQTIQVYKDGAVVKEYSSAEVDSVVYKPAAAAPRYYYYAGWTKPNSETELAELAKKTADEGNGTDFEAKEINIDTFYRKFNNEFRHSEAFWFIVIPNEIGVFATDGINKIEDTFHNPVPDSTTIPGYTIYSRFMDCITGIVLKKK